MTSHAIIGRLTAFVETGTEGVIWSMIMDGIPSYEGLFPLQNGDEILTYDAAGNISWRGVVDLDFDSRRTASPLNPQYQQQEVMGMWVHGLQRGTDAQAWAELFFSEAPAVARFSVGPGRESLGILVKTLNLLKTSPMEAVNYIQSQDPALASRVLAAIPYAWTRLCKDLGWEAQGLEGLEDTANAWQTLLAASRALRSLGPSPSDYTHRRLAEKWGPRQHMGAQQIAHWCAHQLPHDQDLGKPSA